MPPSVETDYRCNKNLFGSDIKSELIFLKPVQHISPDDFSVLHPEIILPENTRGIFYFPQTQFYAVNDLSQQTEHTVFHESHVGFVHGLCKRARKFAGSPLRYSDIEIMQGKDARKHLLINYATDVIPSGENEQGHLEMCKQGGGHIKLYGESAIERLMTNEAMAAFLALSYSAQRELLSSLSRGKCLVFGRMESGEGSVDKNTRPVVIDDLDGILTIERVDPWLYLAKFVHLSELDSKKLPVYLFTEGKSPDFSTYLRSGK